MNFKGFYQFLSHLFIRKKNSNSYEERERSTLVAFAPSLGGLGAHFYPYHKELEKIAALLGLDFFVVLPTECKIEGLPKNWKKILLNKGGLKRILSYCKGFTLFPQKKSHYIIETYSGVSALFFTLAALLFIRRIDFLYILLRYDFLRYRFNGIHIRIQLKLLHFLLRRRLILLTDSDLLSSQYTNVLKKEVCVVPVPHTFSLGEDTIVKKNPYSCWWPGTPREGKGSEKMAFFLQAPSLYQKSFTLYLNESFLLNVPQTDLTIIPFKSGLPDKEYQSLFSKVTFILFPYSDREYARQTSGIFVEAVSCGNIVIVNDHTWMASELKKFNLYELILEESLQDLWKKLYKLAHESHIGPLLKKMRDHYRNFHTATSYAKVLQPHLQGLNVSH